MIERAMILGAGRGTRLGPMARAVPKVLVEIAGVPLLERQLDYLGREGFKQVVVNAHHLADQIEAFARAHRGRVELTVAREERLLGTAGGVRNALSLLGPEPFLVLYGDVLIDESLSRLRSAHLAQSAAATIAVYETREVFGKGTVELDGADRVIAFREKAAVGKLAGPALVNAGVYVIDPDLIRPLPPGVALDFGHDVFPAALAGQRRISALRLARPVIDMGTPDGLKRARSWASRESYERDGGA